MEVMKIVPVNDIKENNLTAKILKVLSVVIWICGAISGGVIAYQTVESSYFDFEYKVFSWEIAFTYWIASFICGLVFMGFSEIIRLLHLIHIQSYQIENFDSSMIDKMVTNQVTRLLEGISEMKTPIIQEESKEDYEKEASENFDDEIVEIIGEMQSVTELKKHFDEVGYPSEKLKELVLKYATMEKFYGGSEKEDFISKYIQSKER